jgi:ADP-L-glycero-D-manno-heptose 6-epimerase
MRNGMILVTGGAGFIGSNLVAALEARGAAVAVCDRLGQGEKWRNLAKRELAAVIEPDGLDEFLREKGGQIAAIFHLGAVSATTERDVDLILRTNFTLSERLWDWSAAHGARFFYASSAAVYGDGRAGYDDDPAALARLRPLNPYGWSKLLFDRRVQRLASESAILPPQWAGFRFFNVYGANEYHKGAMRSVAKQVHERLTAGEPALLFRSHDPAYPDGGQRRDFIAVGDCVDAMMWLYDHHEASGVFNLGTGKARSFAELARAVAAALGSEAAIRYVDTPAELRERYQYFTEAETTRLRLAGYARPFTALEDGVLRYVKDYLSAPDPYL